MTTHLKAIQIFLQLYLAVTAWATSLLVVYGFMLRDRSKHWRPPLVPYLLPWVGSALDMSKDPDNFFKNASNRFGPIFWVKTMGKDITYITLAEVISTVYRDAKKFDFTSVSLDILHNIFGISLKAICSLFMKDHFLPVKHRGLSPRNIIGLLESYTKYTSKEILRVSGQHQKMSTSLVPFLIPLVYSSAAHAFFGRSFGATKSYAPFRKFDDYFHLFTAGVPRFLTPGPHHAWAEVGLMFETYLENLHEDCCKFLLQMESAARDAGWSVKDIANSMAAHLWAMESNAPWAAYWIVALELQKSQGLAPLIAEVDLSREEWNRNHPSKSLQANLYRRLSNTPLPLLTSAIQQSLRLSTSAFSMRCIQESMVFKGYDFKEGELIICATRVVHLNEDIHSKAQEFVSNRYIASQQKFVKKGKIVRNHSMPFGGSNSMCEGRHFALGELKIFMALLLSYVIIEVDPESAARPVYDKKWIGAGLMHPKGDLKVNIQKRHVL